MKPTAAQLRAIESDHKLILGVAGPGSGKTYTLIQRILRLIRSGVDPADIAVIVFTNESARVIHQRLHPESGEYSITLGFLGTLHSFCLRHLQDYAGMQNVTVLDAEEADAELIRCAAAAGVKASPKDLTVRRQWWNVRQFDTQRDAVHIAVASYYRKMAANRALDFNAILTKAHDHLVANVGGGAVQRFWKHLLVDEFQDASRLDYGIYMTIAADNRFFVGDPDQGVFGWRGGDISGILACAGNPDWETILLEGNFRSGPEICAAAQRLIQNGRNRVQKATISLTDKKSSVRSVEFGSDVEEAVKIAEAVAGQMNAGREAREIAVLARTNAIADNVASTLLAHGTPVRRKVAPDIPEDWKLARGGLRMLAARNDDSILRFLRIKNPSGADFIEKQVALGKMKLRERTLAGLECTLDSVGRDLIRLGISRASVERIDKIKNDLPEPTMGDVVLAAVQDFEYEEQGDGVTCTTIHGAKGREWDAVILAGFEDETIPGMIVRDVEEERRLAYVGMTRARETLVVTWARARRQNWGRREHRETHPSRFLAEAGI